MTSIHLSMRLCKPGITLKKATTSFDGMAAYPVRNGVVLTSQRNEDTPEWLKPLKDETSANIAKLHTKSCGAAYLLSVKYKTTKYVVVYTFGTAHHRLDDDIFEPRFGLRIALNSIESSELRNMDVASLDSSTLKRRIQASRSTPVSDFGIDINQDLLTLLSGKSNDGTFARVITGRDSVSFKCPPKPGFFREKAVQAIEIFKKRTYKKNYPWVDYIDTVKDSRLIGDLENDLLAELTQAAKGRAIDASISTPEISDPLVEEAIRYSGAGMKPGKKNTFETADIYDYISEIKTALIFGKISIADIKSQKITLVESGSRKTKSEKIFKCLNMEIKKGGQRYILFSGNWYQIDSKHAKTIEDDFKSFLTPKPIFKPTKAKNERAFISQLNRRTDLLNMDQTKINPVGSTHANIEPCDFLSRKKQLIHLKDAGASSSMSHLWSQGYVSCTLMMTDASFREQFIKETKNREAIYKRSGFSIVLPKSKIIPDPTKFSIVFGVMRTRNKRDNSLDIPFFSKVAMKPSLSAIRLMNFKVFVEIIEKV
ncbi:hypothetical protein CPBF367_05770 [Xanthomonas arboricola pv. juglandis]|uniref:DUF6119 family protein n=1 Tax=Xanthomonas euroxanthea TaxID=2259622 RepID=UPI000E5ABCAA|nr:DUF6119 family protein [Xanthomonas euroxanthea]SYZ51179.1 hypothetical protein CPBF367_05770 [Xanthomonas arboricola pv. juglandis]